MNSELGTFGTWMAILAMAVVTYAIRAGGFWLMGYVPLTRRGNRGCPDLTRCDGVAAQ